MGNPVNAADWRTTVSSMPGPWSEASGFQASREVSKFRAEAAGPELTTSGRVTQGNGTTRRVFDSDRDAPIYQKFSKGERFAGTTITRQALTSDGVPIPGAKVVFTDCQVVSMNLPDGNANGTDNGVLEVVWSIGGVA